ncbi:glycosyl hydrolase family 18 protein [Clostridium aminobutyricum]|uniref:Glycoside hydrolase n=1 Tax=Clostridium aminobutyricum TaxID=33953 RepID=A0A939D923_CLOAM|nr:glycosyl hydrolase family 18 protein [Clostridium aminobutyricum]MBN7773431.1 glycoside hydrolase [Clostridium aminobutyricum]
MEKESILVNGYVYPSISDQLLQAWLPNLSLISTFSYGMTPEGDLIQLNDEKLISAANAQGTGALMVLTPLNAEGRFSNELVSEILENPAAVDNLLNNILQTIKNKGLFGIDFDFEYVAAKNRDQYTDLVSRAAILLNPLGYIVTVALAPKTSEEQVGLLYQGHDYAGMGSAANFVLLMTYEWGYAYGPPMAVAPIDKVRQVLAYGVSQIPPEKILMGIPNYGYDWKLPFIRGETVAEKISNEEAVARAREFGVEIQFDDIAQSPYYYYKKPIAPAEGPPPGQPIQYEEHVVWFEDSRSYAAKMQAIKDFGLTGMSIWEIMSYSQSLIDQINNNFNVAKI